MTILVKPDPSGICLLQILKRVAPEQKETCHDPGVMGSILTCYVLCQLEERKTELHV